MSTATLLGLREKSYTKEELHERIAKAERDFAEGRYYTDDEVFYDSQTNQSCTEYGI